MPDLELKKRFTARGESHEWTMTQDAVAFAAIAACGSATAYALMIRPLLESLGHVPHYAGTAHPSLKKHQDTCLRNLELQMITHRLQNRRDWLPARPVGFQGNFADPRRPLSWGERVKILKPHYGFVIAGKQRISTLQVLRLLGRSQTGQLILQYYDKLKGRPFTEDEDHSARPPVSDENKDRLGRLVLAVDSEPTMAGTHNVFCEIWNLLSTGR
jgi:hypothetical protein